jgi:putative toxin-antitoxin system antitoxin component (TIGR02293 family)
MTFVIKIKSKDNRKEIGITGKEQEMSTAMAFENEEIKKKIIVTLGLKDSDVKPRERDKGMFTFDALIRKGIPYAKVAIVKTALNLTDNEFAAYLGISLRTLQRKRDSQGKLSIAEGDRLFRIAKIFALAAQVLEDDDMARKWLHRPQRGLGGRAPIQVIQTEAGAQEVEDLLEKIEYGVLI